MNEPYQSKAEIFEAHEAANFETHYPPFKRAPSSTDDSVAAALRLGVYKAHDREFARALLENERDEAVSDKVKRSRALEARRDAMAKINETHNSRAAILKEKREALLTRKHDDISLAESKKFPELYAEYEDMVFNSTPIDATEKFLKLTRQYDRRLHLLWTIADPALLGVLPHTVNRINEHLATRGEFELRHDERALLNDIDAALSFNMQWRNIAVKNVDALFNHYRKPTTVIAA